MVPAGNKTKRFSPINHTTKKQFINLFNLFDLLGGRPEQLDTSRSIYIVNQLPLTVFYIHTGFFCRVFRFSVQ